MKQSQLEGFLDGSLLVAMPGMTDSRFARAVVYICAHSADGAMGIVVNKLAEEVSFGDLLVQLEIVDAETEAPKEAFGQVRVHRGGPVETGRGFVLHSADYFLANATLPIDEGVCLTATMEILRAIADGRGPRQALLALGYAGWAAGQLGARDSGERLASLPGGRKPAVRGSGGRQIRPRPVAHRHRAGDAVERRGPRLTSSAPARSPQGCRQCWRQGCRT